MNTQKKNDMLVLEMSLKNNEIFTNCEIRINRAGNVTIQAPNSTTRYTIGTLTDDHSRFWIRGCKKQGWYSSPYRLNMKKVKDDSAWWGYHYEYTFGTLEEVYEYFCNFWKNYKLNK